MLNTFMLLVIVNLTVFGTEQYPDKIIYKRKTYKLHTNPMEIYFEKFPDKRQNLFLIEDAIMSTALEDMSQLLK